MTKGQEVLGSKLDSRQTLSLLIKMTDARISMVNQIQTLTQLTAICSQSYYSKWYYSGMCGCKTCWWVPRWSCLHVCTSFNAWARSCWFQYWMGVQAKWKQWQLIETNGAEVWHLNWEGESAKDGHTRYNDIMLDKCHISAIVACKSTLKHVLHKKLILHYLKKKTFFGKVKY